VGNALTQDTGIDWPLSYVSTTFLISAIGNPAIVFERLSGGSLMISKQPTNRCPEGEMTCDDLHYVACRMGT